MSGDQKQIERVSDLYESEEAISSALKQALRDNDKRIRQAAAKLMGGDLIGYSDTVDLISHEGHFSDELIAGAVRSERDYFENKLTNAAEAKQEGEDRDYKDIVRELRERYRGIYTQDEIIKKISEVDLGIADSDTFEEVASSIYRASDVNEAFDHGENTVALEVLDELIAVKTENNLEKARLDAQKSGTRFNERKAREKAETSARASLKASMTSYWKERYKAAYRSGNTAEKERIERILKASGLYGNASEVIKVCREWRKEKN